MEIVPPKCTRSRIEAKKGDIRHMLIWKEIFQSALYARFLRIAMMEAV